VNDAYEMVLTVATKCCPLLETFKANGFSCLDTVPDGIADADTTEEFATLVGVSRRVLLHSLWPRIWSSSRSIRTWKGVGARLSKAPTQL
jgi:hypothetical protein